MATSPGASLPRQSELWRNASSPYRADRPDSRATALMGPLDRLRRRDACALASLQRIDCRRGDAPGDVAVHQLCSRRPLPRDDQIDNFVMLVEITLPMLVIRGKLEAHTAISIRLVPQIVEQTCEYLVVRGEVDHTGEFAMRDQGLLTPLARDRQQPRDRRTHRRDIRLGATG